MQVAGQQEHSSGGPCTSSMRAGIAWQQAQQCCWTFTAIDSGNATCQASHIKLCIIAMPHLHSINGSYPSHSSPSTGGWPRSPTRSLSRPMTTSQARPLEPGGTGTDTTTSGSDWVHE